MKQPRFFQDLSFHPGVRHALAEQTANHVSRVLRMKEDDNICLFNGHNQECVARLIEVKKRSVVVEIGDVVTCSRESALDFTLVQALSKGDRFDLVVQKAVELGVTKLVPVITERNNVRLDDHKRQKKQTQWQAIIESASEQCGRNALMHLSEIMTLTDYLSSKTKAEHFVLDPYSKQTLMTVKKPSNGAVFLIGPEGGFSDAEIQQIMSFGVQSLCLGPRILRTETAGISVCAIAQAMWGDFA